jgi:hypothetical protein
LRRLSLLQLQQAQLRVSLGTLRVPLTILLAMQPRTAALLLL